jgi:hypothetical protein
MAAATPEGRILEALLTHLKQWVWSGTSIVYSNVQYPAVGQAKADRYIVVSYSPGTPENLFIKSSEQNKHSGILGLSIMTPLNTGELEAQEIGGSLANHFHGKVLTSGSAYLRITARPRVAGGYVDGDRWRTPVTVPFETMSV